MPKWEESKMVAENNADTEDADIKAMKSLVQVLAIETNFHPSSFSFVLFSSIYLCNPSMPPCCSSKSSLLCLTSATISASM